MSGNLPCRVDPAASADAYLETGADFATAATPIAVAAGTRFDAAGAAVGNDAVVTVSPREIFDRVVRRADFGRSAPPAAHLNALIGEMAAVLDKRLQDDTFAGGLPTAWSLPANPLSATPYSVGRVQPVASGGVANVDALNHDKLNGGRSTFAAAYDGYIENWSEQFRQAICPDLDAPCLDVGGNACRGALLFGGRRADGLPRPTADRVATATCDERCILGKHFERNAGAGGLDLLEGSGRFAGPASYDNTSAATRATDVGVCLGRGSFVSLARQASAFAAGVVQPTGGGNPVAAVADVGSGTPAIVLGSATSASRSGCVWYPQALPLDSSLRVYFSYRLDAAGSSARGFVLALADAATNNPAATDPPMCGSAGTASLGYAGAPSSGTATVGTASLAVAAASWSAGSGRATLTTVGSHGFASGQTVVVTGVSPAAYNGSFRILSVAGGTRFSYALPDPGQPRAGIAPPKIGIEFDLHEDASRNDPSADHFAFLHWGSAADNGSSPAVVRSGDDDNLHNAGVAGDPAQPLNPRDLSPAGSPAGIATVKRSDPFLPYASTPLSTDIHVRLDVVRSYDATRRQARLDLRAYVGDNFSLAGNCLLADFRNFARDLAALCPTRTATLAEDGLPIADVAGPALARIYLGFTTARGNSANDMQDIKVQNLMLRAQ